MSDSPFLENILTFKIDENGEVVVNSADGKPVGGLLFVRLTRDINNPTTILIKAVVKIEP